MSKDDSAEEQPQQPPEEQEAAPEPRPRSSKGHNPWGTSLGAWALGDLHKSLSQFSRLTLPQFSVPMLPKIEIPRIGIDPNLIKIGSSLDDIVKTQKVFSGFQRYIEQQHKQWETLFKSLAESFRRALPPNWEEVQYPQFEKIEEILLDEGIPLAWVPRAATLQALFDAPDAAARRRLIGSRWRGITADCKAAIQTLDHPDLVEEARFATQITEMLASKHEAGAQSLAANLLDTVLRRKFDGDIRKVAMRRQKGNPRFDIDEYQIRASFTLAPVWRAYAEYWENNGDPIPKTFGRHPSAHAVSRTQYSRVNAVFGLMLVTSTLKLLNEELER